MNVSSKISLLLLTITVCAFTCEKGEPVTKTETINKITFQPGPEEGQDCLVAYRETDNELYASSNHKPNPDITAIRWTYDADNAGQGTNRTYIKFALPLKLPSLDSIVIRSAKISFYGIDKGVAAPLGNSYFPGSPYESFGENKAWLQRVLEDWNDSTITWNNMPATSSENQVAIPASTSQWNEDALDIDVTDMVKAMILEKKPFGFCLRLQDETIYRSILFASSEAEDETKRPKLVVEYVTVN